MKRLVLFFAGLMLALSVASAADRDQILKVYNWADYIDEDLIDEFEQWYQEQTGKSVEVVYQLFDINEIMLSKIEMGHEDFDVVCPSDYIIERMLRNDLLLPIDQDFGQTPNYISCVSPFIRENFNRIDGSGKNANDYAVGYMWGTTGLLYNSRYVSEEEASSWDVLCNPKFAGKIFIKDAFRDVYTTLLIALNRDRIEAGEVSIHDLTLDSSPSSIALVETYINSFKSNVSGWEADFGKERMTQEKAWLNFTWSGDAQWAIEEAAEMGVPLAYSVPKEGAVIWFDGWVIPKYAKNVDAARYFINFMCRPDNAIRNMDAIGYVSAVGGSEVLEAISDADEYAPIDATYFFGEGAEAVCINPVQYPSTEVIARCGMLHDSGDRTELLLAMWNRVKGDNATSLTYVILIVAVLLLLSVSVYLRRSKKRRSRRRSRR
jgi:spermidine/putrescine transport system substrate-binding protein